MIKRLYFLQNLRNCARKVMDYASDGIEYIMKTCYAIKTEQIRHAKEERP